MEFVHFITQDREHLVGFMVAAWLAFEALKGLIEAWRGQ